MEGWGLGLGLPASMPAGADCQASTASTAAPRWSKWFEMKVLTTHARDKVPRDALMELFMNAVDHDKVQHSVAPAFSRETQTTGSCGHLAQYLWSRNRQPPVKSAATGLATGEHSRLLTLVNCALLAGVHGADTVKQRKGNRSPADIMRADESKKAIVVSNSSEEPFKPEHLYVGSLAGSEPDKMGQYGLGLKDALAF